ncbi:MAG TPA: hypothetical protein VFZ81_14600 [Burkholderiales bacterium]
MSAKRPDQQPIARVVGRRAEPPLGALPSPARRKALDSLARRLTRVPKGVIRYANHEEMIRDRERWTIEAIVAIDRARG